jgi:hypothetical protein
LTLTVLTVLTLTFFFFFFFFFFTTTTTITATIAIAIAIAGHQAAAAAAATTSPSRSTALCRAEAPSPSPSQHRDPPAFRSSFPPLIVKREQGSSGSAMSCQPPPLCKVRLLHMNQWKERKKEKIAVDPPSFCFQPSLFFVVFLLFFFFLAFGALVQLPCWDMYVDSLRSSLIS